MLESCKVEKLNTDGYVGAGLKEAGMHSQRDKACLADRAVGRAGGNQGSSCQGKGEWEPKG